mmetsp:Transcript_10431/g.19484  ORF Transcript_10431/g.19484 Transcript_10431/m.19484 type:complete len:98 (+) Transcript_10431:131-424(+)
MGLGLAPTIHKALNFGVRWRSCGRCDAIGLVWLLLHAQVVVWAGFGKKIVDFGGDLGLACSGRHVDRVKGASFWWMRSACWVLGVWKSSRKSSRPLS